ncbi:MAG: hypothetical protein AVDCRST_MAG01-01-2945, partial [uncultured Rubrobacteraceae bacterium]
HPLSACWGRSKRPWGTSRRRN